MGIYGHGYIIMNKPSVIDEYTEESFTPEFIQAFRESLLNISNEDAEFMNNNFDLIQEAGKAINNKTDINNNIKSAGKDVANEIKKNGLNKKSISSIMDNFWKKCSISLDYTVIEDIKKKDKSFTEAKIIKAIELTLCCGIVNSLCYVVLSVLLGGDIGMQLTASIVAPLVEENAKQISIKNEITKEFAVVFNMYEFTEYVIRYAPRVGLGKMIAVRALAVGVHLTTTAIQWITNNTKLHKKIGIDDNMDNQEKKKRISFLGHLIGILIHAAWNSGAGKLVIEKLVK